jgi:hypothetical protein
LSQVQPLGGAREAAVIHDGDERAKQLLIEYRIQKDSL